MLTLAQYLQSENIKPREFAERLSARLGEPVSDKSVYRWCLGPSHRDYSHPNPRHLIAIYFETDKQVPIEIWFRHLLGQLARRQRKAA